MWILRYLTLAFLLCGSSCISKTEHTTYVESSTTQAARYSLAQWSYHKQLFAGEMDNYDFVRKADSLGFHGVEFVNQFFRDQAQNYEFLDSLKVVLSETETTPVMIMVDLDTDLGVTDTMVRTTSITAHKDWIAASAYLGCQYTRVNAYGDGSSEEVLENCVSSLKLLAEYAQSQGITILVENHGGYSSDGDWLLALINKVDKDNVRLLADFDNWCMKRENGKLWGAPCVQWYDRYQGMDKILPYTNGLSMKTFEFDENGNDVNTDFEKMFALISKHKYNGWLGVEYEGKGTDTDKGVLQTMQLADKMQHD